MPPHNPVLQRQLKRIVIYTFRLSFEFCLNMSTKKRKIEKCYRVDVKLIEKPSKYAIKSDPHDIALPAVIVNSASRGSGKTYASFKLMKHFERKHFATRTAMWTWKTTGTRTRRNSGTRLCTRNSSIVHTPVLGRESVGLSTERRTPINTQTFPLTDHKRHTPRTEEAICWIMSWSNTVTFHSRSPC